MFSKKESVAIKLRAAFLKMQHYLIVWEFPTVEGAWSSCPGFADYINSGAPGDQFDGFELK